MSDKIKEAYDRLEAIVALMKTDFYKISDYLLLNLVVFGLTA